MKDSQEEEEPLFLLFDGTSTDGRGDASYLGRTKDAKLALNHFRRIKKSPYSTGYVDIITDTRYSRVIFECEITKYDKMV